MPDDCVQYRSALELFFIDNKLVAQQQFYVHPFLKGERYEVKHFYCSSCGKAWGLRINPESQSPYHHYYSSTCNDCGGEENMLTPWEAEHLNVLGPNVLAFLLLREPK